VSDSSGGYHPVQYILRKLILCATFASQVVYFLYLEPFRRYLASKLTLLEEYLKNQHILLSEETTWGYPHNLCIFRQLFSWATFSSGTVCLYVYSLKSYKASKLTMLKKATYLVLWGAPGEPPPRAIHFRKLLSS